MFADIPWAHDTDPAWPPGTVKLQELVLDDEGASSSGSSGGGADEKTTAAVIILQPRPTSNPNDPLNWPNWQKAVNFSLACFYAVMVFAFINATSPTWGPLADELGFSEKTLTDTYAIGCATLAVGAPMLIPFALKYGLRSVYLVSSILQCLISVWAARTRTVGDWWGVNATQCWLGALAEVLVQITIADLFFVHQRGRMNSVYIWMHNVGQHLATVVAGFITLDMGWRWVWWLFAVFFGVQVLMFFFGFEDSKFLANAVIAGRRLSKDTKDRKEPRSRIASLSPSPPQSLSKVEIDTRIPRKLYLERLDLLTTTPAPWSHFFRHSWQPFIILFAIPGVLFSAFCYGILTAYFTVMTTAISTYMLDPPYNFDSAQIGLMSLAPFIGQTLGSLVVGPVSDWIALELARRNKGVYEPEMRFWVFLPFIPFQVAGSWWFAYALADGKSWSQVAVAYGISNFGSAPIMAISLTYILDAYNEIVGDALTAVTILRNTISTIFVFAMPAWIARAGIPNVFNTIGAIALLILSFSAFFLVKGKYLRWKTAGIYKYYARRQFQARPV